jgi:NAD(P)-dependent dehydrogenase (short-subunit alcohol dehydrogenase family)
MSKIILITGCSTRLGASLSVQAARRGFVVYASMSDLAKRQVLDAAAAAAGVALNVLALDVQRSDSVNAAVADVIAREGRIDVLVNNAGVGFARATEQASEAEIEWVMDVNFMGAVRTTRAVLPHMRHARSGHIVNISSVGGLVGQPFNEVYCASKFALEGYTEALASYVQPGFGIRFTAVEPGGIRSEFAASARKQMAATGGLLDDAYRPLLDRYIAGASRRGPEVFQAPDEVAAAVWACVESSDPPLRLRTSPWGEELCALKTAADPDGRRLQRKVTEMFLGP